MAEKTQRTIQRNVMRGGDVRMPVALVEECGLKEGGLVDVVYGSNFSCVVVYPTGTVLGDKQKERIKNLVCEPMDTKN